MLSCFVLFLVKPEDPSTPCTCRICVVANMQNQQCSFRSNYHVMRALYLGLLALLYSFSIAQELTQTDDLDRMREKTLLEIFGETMKQILTKEIFSDTERECRWDWRSLQCEPKCWCGFKPQFGDYHLGRSCRADHKVSCVDDEAESNYYYNIWVRMQEARRKAREKIKTRISTIQESACTRVVSQSCTEEEDVALAWQESLFCQEKLVQAC